MKALVRELLEVLEELNNSGYLDPDAIDVLEDRKLGLMDALRHEIE